MPGPLEGISVVDCSWGIAGPLATGMLADYGADVIRVEPPAGDPVRSCEPSYFAAYARGMRSLTLDLKAPQAHDVMSRLIANADVFVESWRPGVAVALGL